MSKVLCDDVTAIAITLSAGVVKTITPGNLSKIMQTYIQSPLLCGIHVNMKSPFNSVSDLEGKKVAISRYGSGSHLMSYVNAQNEGWNPVNLDFEVVNNLKGAIEALTNGKADYFLWEHFTTKPIVDKGIFR